MGKVVLVNKDAEVIKITSSRTLSQKRSSLLKKLTDGEIELYSEDSCGSTDSEPNADTKGNDEMINDLRRGNMQSNLQYMRTVYNTL